mgnify:CR=1 FL=1
MKHLTGLFIVIATIVGAFLAPGVGYAVNSDAVSVESVSSVVFNDACDQDTALERGDSLPCQEACIVPCAANSIGITLTQSRILTFMRLAENRVERTAADAFNDIVSAVDLSPPRRVL